MITAAEFVDIVDRVLLPMLSTNGLAMVATDDFTVEFRGPSASLTLRYEERAHELTVWVSDVEDASGEPPLELSDVLRSTDCPVSEVEAVSLIQAHDIEPLRRLLGRVAEVIGSYAGPFLGSDQRCFDAARRIRADRARAYTAELVNAPAIAEADTAWQSRDYERVCKILCSIGDQLDDTHRRRLAFAESRCSAVTDAFAVTMNGRTSYELKPRWAEEEIVKLLSRLDGVDRYSMSLWELPENIPFDGVDVNDWPHEYVQCAGSFEGRLTAELREVRHGSARQYVIGRISDAARDGVAADEVVLWNGYEASVRPNEVLTGSEVQELLLFYYRTGELPDSYTRREIEP